MKKNIFILLIETMCVFLLASCSNADTANKELFSGYEFKKLDEGNRPVYNSLDELENECDIIVVGTFTGDARQDEVYTYEESFGKDVLSFIISQNDIEVSKVIKGNVKVGDKISVIQLYGTVDTKFMTNSNLTPMLKDDKWLFFLSESNGDYSGAYYCTGDNDGRYPLENFSYRKTALTDNENLGVYNKEDFREDIYKEILKKYDLK